MLICRWHNIGISHWVRQVFGKGDQRPQNPGRFCETNSPIQQFLKKAKLAGHVLQTDLDKCIVLAFEPQESLPVHAFGASAIAVQDARLPAQALAQFLGPAGRTVASAFLLRGVTQPVAVAAGKVFARRVEHCHPLAAPGAGKPAALPAKVAG